MSKRGHRSHNAARGNDRGLTGAADQALALQEQPLREALAAHEALRRLDYASEHIFFRYADLLGAIQCVLRAPDQPEFVIDIPWPGHSEAEFVERWRTLHALVDVASEEALQQLWKTSEMRARAVGLVLAMTAKGLRTTTRQVNWN